MTNSQQTQRRTGRNNGDFKQYLGFEKKFGYLHEFREIPNSSPKVYTAKISVPHGQGGNIKYSNFELYVKTADALSLFLDHKDKIDDKNVKVTIRFSSTNVQARGYVAQSGRNVGEVISYFSGNLSYLYFMKINGEQVYGFKPMEQAANESLVTNSNLQDAVVVNTATGEILPQALQESPPPSDDVPVEAYEETIAHAMDGEQDVQHIMDDEPGTDTNGHLQGKASLSLNHTGAKRRVPAKGNATPDTSAVTI